jgi:hypothetical protein
MMSTTTNVKDAVRQKYGEIATSVGGACCGPESCA